MRAHRYKTSISRIFLYVRLTTTTNKKPPKIDETRRKKRAELCFSYRAGDGFTSLFWPPLVHSFERSHKVLGHHRIGFFQS